MILDKITSSFAPFYCLGCSRRGYLLCGSCFSGTEESVPSRCYRCHKSTLQSQICKSCRSTSALSHVWVASVYEGLAKDLIERLKFGRSAGASKDIARILDDIVPFLPDDTIITYIPTANSRVRQRGYDQSMLIAKELAKIRNLKLANTLNRLTKTRQLGASRDQRFEQAKKAFEVSSKLEVNGRGFLVVDDVTTSGATLESAAKLLKKAGAKTVDGVVFAQAIE